MFDLSGKKVLITGSSQGIGKEIARALSGCGATVFVHGIAFSDKLTAAKEYSGAYKAVAADLTQSDAAEKLYEQTGSVDILILNASIQTKKPWNEFTEEEFDNHISCNLKSSYFLIKKYSNAMRENKWGRIITLGSVNQYNNHPELSIYSVTKAAQFKLVQNIAPCLAPYGITVNNIAPGAISTPRNAEALSDKDFNAKVVASIPAGFIGSPADICGAAILLSSNEGRYITGSEIVIDGGMSL